MTVAPVPVIVPHVDVHVTDASAAPVTSAVNEIGSSRKTNCAAGDTLTDALFTVTVAVPVLVGSATDVAVTVTLPPVAGAVSVALLPLATMLPADVDHVTAVLLELLTVAVNCCVAPASIVEVAGETATEAAVTVTVADALLVGSSTLVAVTVHGPPLVGAVYVRELPSPDKLPHDADHVTDPLLTVTVNVCVSPPFTLPTSATC